MIRSVSPPKLDAPLARLCDHTAPDSCATVPGVEELASLWRLATRHGLRPLLARSLSAQGVELPSPMQAERLALSTDSLRFTQALIEILQAFAAQNIRLLGYKGPTLAALLHQNVSLREFLDIDILVSASDVSAAIATLERMGYVTDQRFTRRQDRHFRATASNFTFLDRHTGVSVELHWQIALRFSGIRFDFDELWSRRTEVALGNGRLVPTFSPVDQLLILALHGARHFWESLCWTADVAYLLRRDDLDFDSVWARGRSLRLTGLVAWALRLAHECFAVRVPAIPGEVSASSLDHALALSYRRIRANIVPPELTFSEHAAFAALLGPLPARLAYFTRLLLTPSPTDWAEHALPDRLHFAYPVLRLSRVVRKSVRTAK